MAKISDITVKDIFDNICALNAGGYFRYEKTAGQQIADNCAGEINSFLPAGSLAKKILMSSSQFSAKQLWVIAYELIKNEEYIAYLVANNRAYNLEMYGDEDIE